MDPYEVIPTFTKADRRAPYLCRLAFVDVFLFSWGVRAASTFIAIDLKSYYASVECVHRGLDPLSANLLVADESRTDKTICLAVSPALKAIGVSSRPRLFEAKQAIRLYEAQHHTKVDYIVAVPRMAEYERISAQIYAIYLRYVATEDIHVYSIDECFLDITAYLGLHRREAEAAGMPVPHYMALRMIRDVIRETGITATVGIGPNLYLAKVAMDIVAKKQPADADGVRIAELDERQYRRQLWGHRPITAFWHVGPGTARKLAKYGMYTMGDIARMSLADEEFLYRLFGINAEILIDHAWGLEPVTMKAIKEYRPRAHSLSVGQVLPRPYRFAEARLVFSEMIDQLSLDLVRKNVKTRELAFWVSFDSESLEACPNYEGAVSLDYYGRLHPNHTGGAVRLRTHTSSTREIMDALLWAFDQRVDKRLLVRRLGVAACDIRDGYVQLDIFMDPAALEQEEHIQRALLEIRRRFGANAILKGKNFLAGGTARERNQQIGGHRA